MPAAGFAVAVEHFVGARDTAFVLGEVADDEGGILNVTGLVVGSADGDIEVFLQVVAGALREHVTLQDLFDQELFIRGLGTVTFDHVGEGFGVLFVIFAIDDKGIGCEAVLKRIARADAFTGFRFGTGGVLGIAAVRFDLQL